MSFDTKILEFSKIKELLKQKAQTASGKDKVDRLEPMTDEESLRKTLHETKEAYQYIAEEAEPSFFGVHDLSAALKRTDIQGTLEPRDFIEVLDHIEASARIKRETLRYPERIEETFDIARYAEAIEAPETLKKAIKNVFDDHGEIKDDASKELKSIRKELNTQERRIKDALETALKREKKKLAEELITIRHDRYVIPIKAGDKNSVKGTIIDYSNSGETAYIEPSNVQSLTAKKLQLETKEKHEIEKILTVLSAEVGNHSDVLRQNTHLISELDFLFAKADYGYEIEGAVPDIKDTIHLLKARHPLIPKEEVVANTITFDKETKMMVITGSNTGGKTVALKTIGLLNIMAQSGMMIPVLEGSSIRLFDAIRADIGDEQSIEQSLSTFSSHMSRIVDILKHYDDNQLILLDELGSGTDPKEGSALAMSILEHLAQKESIVVATTHYPELKAYAYTKDFVMNASVEFDEETLNPTYRLLLRTPGESHAFLIGERLGLSKTIIEGAQKDVLTTRSEVSDLIDKLKKESVKLDQEVQKTESLRKELEEERQAVKDLKRELQSERETIREKLEVENQKAMRQTKEKAEQLIRELEEMKTKSFKEHELAEKKHAAKTLEEKKDHKTDKSHDFKPGDRVYILKFNRYGELEKRQKGGWLVKMGALKSVFKEDEIEYAEEQKREESSKQKQTPKTPKKQVSSTLDLRGERVESARERLMKYIDDCALSKQPYATVIHGFGTLALRKMVKEVASEHDLVKRHRDGEGSEGGQGVTVLYFD